MIKRMLVGTAILFGVLLLLLPKTDDASKKKMPSAGMLMCSNDARTAIAKQLLNQSEIDWVFNNTCPKLIAGLNVDEDGVITLRGAQHGVVMVMTPGIEGDKVRWSCRGEPADAVSSLCKH